MSVRVCAVCGVVRPSLSDAKVWLCEKCEPWDTALSSNTHPPGEGEIAEGDPSQGPPTSSDGTKFCETLFRWRLAMFTHT
jgi:hypothetical protein